MYRQIQEGTCRIDQMVEFTDVLKESFDGGLLPDVHNGDGGFVAGDTRASGAQLVLV